MLEFGVQTTNHSVQKQNNKNPLKETQIKTKNL